MNAERTARTFTWWMKANRKVAFYEEESRQKQKAIDPWNVKHVNHSDNIGSEDWCKWNQWSMRSEILRAKLENRPANHWFNCAISNDECERRSALARERFDAKQLKASNLLRLQIQEQQTTVVPGNCVTAEHRRVIEMLLNVCATAFELADDSCQQDVDGEDCHVVPNDAFQKLSDALDEIENTLPTEDIDRPNVLLAWSAMPRAVLKPLLHPQALPLVLPRPCTVEGYHIDEAYLVEVPPGREWDQDECAFAADEVINALKAAGIPFTIKE